MHIESAFAMDGGSIALSLSDGDATEGFTMDRSIASLGTSQYEVIVNESGVPLAPDERATLLARLVRERATLVADDRNLYAVDEYIKVLQRT